MSRKFVLYKDFSGYPKTSIDKIKADLENTFRTSSDGGIPFLESLDSLIVLDRENYPTELVQFR